MKKLGAAAAKTSAPAAKIIAFSSSPLSSPSSDGGARSGKPTSKIPFDFDLAFAAATTAASSSKRKARPPSPFICPSSSSPAAPRSIADLKGLAAAEIDTLKRQLDTCHSNILKDFDTSKTRISKRLKIQKQACIQLSEDAEKDYKKVIDRINERTDLIKASYAEFIAEAQKTATRVSKVSVPKLAQSMEKAIEGLRSRYTLPADAS